MPVIGADTGGLFDRGGLGALGAGDGGGLSLACPARIVLGLVGACFGIGDLAGGVFTGWAQIRSHFPHPDGAATWADAGRQVRFLLEYDTGSESLPALTRKLDGYQALAEAAATRNNQACPVLLFCFSSPHREQSARRALAAAREAPALRIATAALDPRLTSPAGPVWLPLLTRTGHQVPLIDLDDALPDPWLAYRQERARRRREFAERDRKYRDDQDDEDWRAAHGRTHP